MAWIQRTHNTRRQSGCQARWQLSHWARTVKPNSVKRNKKQERQGQASSNKLPTDVGGANEQFYHVY